MSIAQKVQLLAEKIPKVSLSGNISMTAYLADASKSDRWDEAETYGTYPDFPELPAYGWTITPEELTAGGPWVIMPLDEYIAICREIRKYTISDSTTDAE